MLEMTSFLSIQGRRARGRRVLRLEEGTLGASVDTLVSSRMTEDGRTLPVISPSSCAKIVEAHGSLRVMWLSSLP
jgi:hypothetical protein